MSGFAKPAADIDVLDHDNATALRQPNHFKYHLHRVRHDDQEQALVSQMKRLIGQLRGRRVAHHDFHICKFAPSHYPFRQLDEPRFPFHADHLALRSDFLGQQVKNAKRATA